ncbi:MAG: hypothetical protein KIT09_19970 [Bryobacteraceae bacterium]|nr:hypothetical protein [Bryobacteraceae bacterium]
MNTVPTLALGQPPEIAATDLRSGGPNWVDGRELNTPYAVAVDRTSGALYVADTGNNRVLGWRNPAAAANGSQADIVIGQRDRFSNGAIGPGSLVSGLNRPTGLAVDANGHLYVIDAGNNRIVRYKRPFEQPDDTKLVDLVIGQTSVTGAGAATAINRIRPISPSQDIGNVATGLAFDSQGNLYFTDTGNHRVLRFPASRLGESAPHGPDADLILGQAEFDSSTQPNINNNTRQDKSVMREPNCLAFDSRGRLYVADRLNRVLVFAPPVVPRQSATRIMGRYVATPGSPAKPAINDFSLGVTLTATRWLPPTGIFTIGEIVFVVDTAAHRIMRYSSYDTWAPESSLYSPSATAVIGQANLTSDSPQVNRGLTEPAANTLAAPVGAAFHGGAVYVADAGNNRVLAYPDLSTGDQTSPTYTAQRVLGQTNFEFRAVNMLEGREFGFQFPGVEASGGMAIDRNSDPPRLYVADTYNNRVLCYADARRVRPEDRADYVIGQVGLQRSIVNWPSGLTDVRNTSGLYLPTGVAVDAQGNLYVADRGNSRVLRFPRPFQNPKNLPEADLVIGQFDFTSRIIDPSPRTMRSPWGLAFTREGWLLVSDASHHRVLLFQPPFLNGAAAVRAFGQPNLGVSDSGSASNRLNSPRDIAIDSEDRLYVADAVNRRVQIFGRVTTAGDDPTAVLSIPNLRAPTGVLVNAQTGEIWVAEQDNNTVHCRQNTPCVLRFPRFDTIVTQGANADVVIRGTRPFSLAQDGFGDLFVADVFNRILIHFPGLTATNGANYLTRVAPGTITSLFLPNITSIVTRVFNELPNPIPLPTTLSDVQVLVDQRPAPIYFVAPTQVNFLIPNTAPTSGDVEVLVLRPSTRQILAAALVRMDRAAPAFFTKTQDGSGQIAALNQNNTENSAANPARAGEVVALFGTGSGFVPNAPPDGTPPSGPTPTDELPRVIFNSRFIEGAENIPYSGLAPSLVGVWQINVKVPDFAPPGENVIIMTMKDVPSNDPSRPTRIRATLHVVR